MIALKPTALVSQAYKWEGEDAVEERLVFLSDEQVRDYEKNKDPKQATFKVRSVKQGDGTYAGIVRLGNGYQLWEYPLRAQTQMAMLTLMCETLLLSFEIKPVELAWVPDKNKD